ncbi:hypothetical protein NDU88_000851 [Pleurodeles waltl]|uniref:Uncharacterized protein n=1 Tax=Pleurodeles waltl TaxID=8319 RepID=A0AAV7TG74_PLEWA|nr:hypothetical protein NDU88_000851 [Pleurodeles waltl]
MCAPPTRGRSELATTLAFTLLGDRRLEGETPKTTREARSSEWDVGHVPSRTLSQLRPRTHMGYRMELVGTGCVA